MSYASLAKGRYSEAGQVYFVTTVLADRQARYFADFQCARLLIGEMRALHDTGEVDSLAWVVMPDHLHWLFQMQESSSLVRVMKALKAKSAQRVNRLLKRQGALWQKAYYDRAVRKDEDLLEIARYIVANPLRAGLVDKLGNYPLWDAVWL
ncbi:MAG: transposase [Pseudomonadota bacterium]